MILILFVLSPLLVRLGSTTTDVVTETSLVTLLDNTNKMHEEALSIRSEGYSSMSQAFDVLVEAFALIKSQTSENARELQNSLNTVITRMDRMVTMIEELDSKVESVKEDSNNMTSVTLTDGLGQLETILETMKEDSKQKLADLGEKTTWVKKQVDASVSLARTIKVRQEAWISEVRLISLYKISDENNRRVGWPTGVVNDGQFLFDFPTQSQMRTYTHTASNAANNKLWITLGGYFRIYKVQVWNHRTSQGQFDGTQIYADNHLIGTASGSHPFYAFLVPEEDPVYASAVTLHQPRSQYLHIIELQVWGNGPFNKTDIFT